MVAAAHSFVASFPTFRTYSNVLAGFGAVAVFLALEAAQRVGNVWLDRDPRLAVMCFGECGDANVSTTVLVRRLLSPFLTCMITAAVTP